MSKKTDIIISTYNQANQDANELLKYIESISTPGELDESKFPSLVRHLENKDSDIARIYIDGAAIMGGNVAVAIGTSITAGLLSQSLMVGGAMAIGKIGLSMIPGLNLFTIPVLALPIAIKTLSDSKIKKYVKENKKGLEKNKEQIAKGKEKLFAWLNKLQVKTTEIDEKLRKEIKEKFNDYKEKTKKFAKDVSIQIDDCINANTNKRILQYNEVILNQYKLQRELEEKVDFLFDEYNKLLIEKQELERQVNCLLKLLTSLGCPESVINQALNGSEV